VTKRILVVEDQEDLRGILRDLLTGSGYDVVEAAKGCFSSRGLHKEPIHFL
jgi:CheY-like chemotaxis protein